MDAINALRPQVDEWTLEADQKLLNALRGFSRSILESAVNVQNDIEELCFSVDTADVRLQNTVNELLLLSNTQFIENRVREDTGEDAERSGQAAEGARGGTNGTGSEAQTPDEIAQKQDLAIQLGMRALALFALDENDDDDAQESVKDIYNARPLPFIIGSRAFEENADVGLGPTVEARGYEAYSDEDRAYLKDRGSVISDVTSEGMASGDLHSPLSTSHSRGSASAERGAPSSRRASSFENGADHNASEMSFAERLSEALSEGVPSDDWRPSDRRRSSGRVKPSDNLASSAAGPADGGPPSGTRASSGGAMKSWDREGGLFSADPDDPHDLFGSLGDSVSQTGNSHRTSSEDTERAGGATSSAPPGTIQDQLASLIGGGASPAPERDGAGSRETRGRSVSARKVLADLLGPRDDEGGLFGAGDEDEALFGTGISAVEEEDRAAEAGATPRSTEAAHANLFADDDDGGIFAKVDRAARTSAATKPQAKAASLLGKPAKPRATKGGLANLFADDDDDDIFGKIDRAARTSAASKPQAKAASLFGDDPEDADYTAEATKPQLAPRANFASLFGDDGDTGGGLFGSSPSTAADAAPGTSAAPESKAAVVASLFGDDGKDREALFEEGAEGKACAGGAENGKVVGRGRDRAGDGLFSWDEDNDGGPSEAQDMAKKAKASKKNLVSLFGEDGELFGATKPAEAPPEREKKQQRRLFDDDDNDDDDDLFSASPKAIASAPPPRARAVPPPDTTSSPSLFDDGNADLPAPPRASAPLPPSKAEGSNPPKMSAPKNPAGSVAALRIKLALDPKALMPGAFPPRSRTASASSDVGDLPRRTSSDTAVDVSAAAGKATQRRKRQPTRKVFTPTAGTPYASAIVAEVPAMGNRGACAQDGDGRDVHTGSAQTAADSDNTHGGKAKGCAREGSAAGTSLFGDEQLSTDAVMVSHENAQGSALSGVVPAQPLLKSTAEAAREVDNGKAKVKGLFGSDDDEDDDDDFFVARVRRAKPRRQNAKARETSLFGDRESDDGGLFGDDVEPKAAKTTREAAASLFGDDDDGGDGGGGLLFGAVPATTSAEKRKLERGLFD